VEYEPVWRSSLGRFYVYIDFNAQVNEGFCLGQPPDVKSSQYSLETKPDMLQSLLDLTVDLAIQVGRY
jgi:hypothetical protein